MLKLPIFFFVGLLANDGFTRHHCDTAQLIKMVDKNSDNSPTAVEGRMKNQICLPELNKATRAIKSGHDLEVLIKLKFKKINNIDLFIKWLKCNYFNVEEFILDNKDPELRYVLSEHDDAKKIVKINAFLPRNTLLKSQDSSYSRWGGGFLNIFKSPTIWDQLHEGDFSITIFSLPDARLLKTSSVIVNK